MIRNTWSSSHLNKGEGHPPSPNQTDAIVAQLAAIADRLDALISLKDDVAALKTLMYGGVVRCNDQNEDFESHPRFDDFGNDKDPEDGSQGPSTGLVKEDDTDKAPTSQYLAPSFVQAPASVDGTIDSTGLGGTSSSCNNHNAVKTSSLAFDGEREKSLEYAEVLMKRGPKANKEEDYVEATDCFRRSLEIWAAQYGELVTECVRSYYKYGCAFLYKAHEESDPLVSGSMSKKAVCNSQLIHQSMMAQCWVFDPGPQDFPRAVLIRLEDKSFLRKGSIDTNPDPGPYQNWIPFLTHN